MWNKNYRSFIILFKLFALAPFSTHPTIRYFLYLYSFFQISMIFVIGFAVVCWKDLIEKNAMSTMVNYLFLMGIASTHFIIVLQAFATRCNQLRLLQSITEIDIIFQEELSITVPAGRRENRSIWIRFFAILIVISLIHIFLTCYLYFDNTEDFLYLVHYSFLLMLVRYVQTLFYMFLLCNRLNVIDGELLKFVCSEGNLASGSFIRSLRYERLLNLKRIYGKLHDFNQILNDTFGWSLLAMFTHWFINFTTYSYWMFMAFYGITIDCTLIVICVCLLLEVMIVTIYFIYCSSTCAQMVKF